MQQDNLLQFNRCIFVRFSKLFDPIPFQAETMTFLVSKEHSCDHPEGWVREGGREMQEGGDMGIYVYI